MMNAQRLVVAIFLFTLCLAKTSAKDSPEITTYYVSGISWLTSGSGQGSGISLYAGVGKGRKFLKAGLLLNDNGSKVSGADFEYRIFLGDDTRLLNGERKVSPYLQYNLLYQKRISYAPDVIRLGEEIYYIESDPGTVATMGHYASLGSILRIFHHIIFDASLGLGLYSGSVDPVNGPGTWGIHKENYGLTFTCKAGISYTFGR